MKVLAFDRDHFQWAPVNLVPDTTIVRTIIAVRAGVYLEQALAGPEYVCVASSTSTVQ